MSFEFKLPPEELAKLRAPHKPLKEWRPSRRMIVGGLLVAVAFAILVRSFVFTAGYNTTLVANLGYVRAPMSGVVGPLNADVGDKVRRDQALGVFASPVGLAAALKAGSEDLDQLQAELRSLNSRIRALQSVTAQIRQDADLYRDAKSAQLLAVGDEASAEVSAADARVDLTEQQLQRARTLYGQGYMSTAGLQKAEQDHRSALASQTAAIAKQRGDRIEAQAAKKGFLLTNGYSDVQYSTQRLSDLALALSDLEGKRDIVNAALASAQSLNGHSGKKARRTFEVPLNASVDGRVWAKVAASGETLREGEPIYMLADCSSFFVYFTVGRSTYSNLEIGTPVTFRSFVHGEHWPGNIVNMGVSDPSQLRVTSQIAAPGPGEYLIGARIMLDPESRKTCPVGTAGRVVL